jgi:hypothetical protein
MKSTYHASNKKNYEKQTLWFNNRVTWLSYMEYNLYFLALNSFYKNQSICIMSLQSKKDNKAFQRRIIIKRISYLESAYSSLHSVDINNSILLNISSLFGAIRGLL